MSAANGTPTMANLTTAEHKEASNRKMANLANAAKAREESASPFNWLSSLKNTMTAPKSTAFANMGTMKNRNNTLRPPGQQTPQQTVTTEARFKPEEMVGTKLFGGRRRTGRKSKRSRRSQRKTQRR